MREPDVLDVSAREHRELQRSLRSLTVDREPGDDLEPDALADLAAAMARHEALDRLLLYPLVGRDGYGRRSLVDRRAEQRSISDQLAKALRVNEALRGEGAERPEPLLPALLSLRLTFVGHSDREEIEDFPHARRLSSRDERHELAGLRQSLGDQLRDRLPTVPATTHREASGHRIGPLQAAIVQAKEIIAMLDSTRVGVR